MIQSADYTQKIFLPKREMSRTSENGEEESNIFDSIKVFNDMFGSMLIQVRHDFSNSFSNDGIENDSIDDDDVDLYLVGREARGATSCDKPAL